jgi:hypothetical protein
MTTLIIITALNSPAQLSFNYQTTLPDLINLQFSPNNTVTLDGNAYVNYLIMAPLGGPNSNSYKTTNVNSPGTVHVYNSIDGSFGVFYQSTATTESGFAVSIEDNGLPSSSYTRFFYGALNMYFYSITNEKIPLPTTGTHTFDFRDVFLAVTKFKLLTPNSKVVNHSNYSSTTIPTFVAEVGKPSYTYSIVENINFEVWTTGITQLFDYNFMLSNTWTSCTPGSGYTNYEKFNCSPP